MLRSGNHDFCELSGVDSRGPEERAHSFYVEGAGVWSLCNWLDYVFRVVAWTVQLHIRSLTLFRELDKSNLEDFFYEKT